MASAVGTDKLTSNLYVHVVDHDPGATTAKIASADGGTTLQYVDFRDYSNLLVVAAPSVIGGNGVTLLEIVAATDAAFTTPVQIKTSGAIQLDADADYAVLECSSEDLKAVSTASLRYVSARLTNATATDEVKVIFVATPKHPQDGLTATNQT